MRLMEMEVPEIYDGTVIIRGCVRQPGDRAKVAVSSRERDVDPVGACVGMRGARVQAIMRELRGERIDIIQFSDDLVTYAQNALSPAKITRVSVMPGEDEEEPEVGPDGEPLEPLPTLECIVEEDQLSLAIGKRGQNVRLAAALIGAKIEIKSEQAVKAEVAEALQRMLLSSSAGPPPSERCRDSRRRPWPPSPRRGSRRWASSSRPPPAPKRAPGPSRPSSSARGPRRGHRDRPRVRAGASARTRRRDPGDGRGNR